MIQIKTDYKICYYDYMKDLLNFKVLLADLENAH